MARFLIVAALGMVALATSPARADDVAAGQAFFKNTCGMCHATTAGAPAGIGPRLVGVVGRKAGSSPGYTYSKAMAAAGFVWTPEKLKAYLAGPQSVVKGNKMPYAGISNPVMRNNVVAYLLTLH